MSYIQEFEQELAQKLMSGESAESVIRWVSERMLQSYRNGIKAGRNGETVKRDGKSRRRDSFGNRG